jgi:hypothetical protein
MLQSILRKTFMASEMEVHMAYGTNIINLLLFRLFFLVYMIIFYIIDDLRLQGCTDYSMGTFEFILVRG